MWKLLDGTWPSTMPGDGGVGRLRSSRQRGWFASSSNCAALWEYAEDADPNTTWTVDVTAMVEDVFPGPCGRFVYLGCSKGDHHGGTCARRSDVEIESAPNHRGHCVFDMHFYTVGLTLKDTAGYTMRADILSDAGFLFADYGYLPASTFAGLETDDQQQIASESAHVVREFRYTITKDSRGECSAAVVLINV